MAQQDERTAERTPGPWDEAPDFLAHWVVKTARRGCKGQKNTR